MTAGMCGLVWHCVWYWMAFEKPALHPTISAREHHYIEKSLGDLVSIHHT